MKKTLSAAVVAAVVLCFSLSAFAIHDTPVDGAKFQPAGPDAAKLYSFITMGKPNYSHWSQWPGTKEYSPSKAPHGPMVTTYANKAALDSIKDEKGLADGSIIVMENYTAEKKLEGCTVMYKIKDYNPAAGDWFWANYSAPNGYVVDSGKVSSCIVCHSDRKDADFLFSAR